MEEFRKIKFPESISEKTDKNDYSISFYGIIRNDRTGEILKTCYVLGKYYAFMCFQMKDLHVKVVKTYSIKELILNTFPEIKALFKEEETPDISTNLVQVGKSKIHGLGLFAKEDIKKNQKICDYIGEKMTIREFRERYGEYKNNSLNTYIKRRTHQIIVAKEEPYKTKNLVNYINEDIACPNTVLKRGGLYSCEEIKKGTELTLLYPRDYNRTWNWDACDKEFHKE